MTLTLAVNSNDDSLVRDIVINGSYLNTALSCINNNTEHNRAYKTQWHQTVAMTFRLFMKLRLQKILCVWHNYILSDFCKVKLFQESNKNS